jgi:uncharacterized protein (DUF1778 family)
MPEKSTKVKRRKFRKITFKVSKNEYEILEKCAMLESTTINKFIKRNIRNGIDEMMPRLKQWLDQLQPENQLELFSPNKFDEPAAMQTSMVEEYDEFYNENKENE